MTPLAETLVVIARAAAAEILTIRARGAEVRTKGRFLTGYRCRRGREPIDRRTPGRRNT